MNGSKLTLRQGEGDIMQFVVEELQDVKRQLAELKDEVKLVKRSSAGSEMEQLKMNVAESNSVIKLLAADFNTTRTMMMSELRNILYAIPRGNEDTLQEQLATANEALQQARTEPVSRVEALQRALSDTTEALRQAEIEVSEGSNSQNELQRELQATKEDVMKAKKEVKRLKGELVKAKLESSDHKQALQKEFSDMKGTLQQAETDVAEGNSRQKELQRELEETREDVMKAKKEVKRLKGELVKARLESSDREQALEKEFSDMKGALQQAETDVLEGSNRQEELQRELQAAREEVMEAKEGVKRLEAKLLKVKNESAKNKEGEPKPEDNKIGLKYTYKKDQWSPLNQEGKKQYDRVFLLQFQPDCTSKPQGLPDIPDIVLEKADVRLHLDTKSMTSIKGPDNLFMPTYMKSPRINNQQPSFPSGGRRQSKERQIISRPSTSTEEKLKRAENAWKPDAFKKKKEEEEGDNEDDQHSHQCPVPPNRLGVPSPSASPGTRRTSHEMSKQGVLQQTIVGPQAGFNMLPPQQYRMLHQPGQLHPSVAPQSYGMPGAQRQTALQSALVPSALAAQGNSGARIIQPAGAKASPYIQNQNFVAGHQMLSAPMQQFAPKASGQFSTTAAPFPYYFSPTQALPQSQGYYPGASQLPPQTSYNPPVVMSQQPTTSNPPPQRRKRILRIQDPTCSEDVTDSIMRDCVGGASVSTQDSATGSVGTQPQQHQDESNEIQKNRRIQAEFLSNLKVSQADNDESD